MKTQLLVIVLACVSLSVYAEDRVEYSSDPARSSGIGYSSVEDALESLREKDGVVVRVEQGWTLAEDRAENTIWSFTPEEHPANPAVVKRTFFEEAGAMYLTMNVLCQATKPECDKLVAEFQELNNRIQEGMRGGR